MAAGLKNDRWIREHAKTGMIEPYCEQQVRGGAISYGVSSYGYDSRLSNEFKLFKTADEYTGVIDPKAFDVNACTDICTNEFIMPPHSFALARSLEYFRIPRSVGCICFNKSTYARVGLVTGVTPLEPEWEGHITIELSNTTPLPIKVYALEGIIQVLFLEADEWCEVSYADRKGKYQSQTGITVARI